MNEERPVKALFEALEEEGGVVMGVQGDPNEYLLDGYFNLEKVAEGFLRRLGIKQPAGKP